MPTTDLRPLLPTLQPCQRTGSYHHEHCEHLCCANPWCDRERRRRGLLRKFDTPSARRKQALAAQRRRDAPRHLPPPAYCHSYHGVTWRYKRWRAQIDVDGELHDLGSYPGTTAGEEQAARRYDQAVRTLALDLPANFPLDPADP